MNFKILLVAILTLSSILASAQKKGIEFLQLRDWQNVKEKAKKENKIIFVDFYTTWCIPCREMAAKVLSKPDVGNFFNANFINVAVQLDSTKNDNPNVQRWYKDANQLKIAFKINSFPTYLFFNSAGELVHSVETNFDRKAFIERAKAALNPETQNVALRRLYQEGRRDTGFLVMLINSSQSNRNYGDVSKYTNDYLAAQTNLFTKKNLISIGKTTSNSKDVGFSVLLNNADSIDSLFGKGYAERQVTMIIFDEEVLPVIRTGGVKKIFGPGMYSYEGDIKKNIDWNLIEKNVYRKYPHYVNDVMLYSKLDYFMTIEDWKSYCQEIESYMSKYPFKIDIRFLDHNANTVLTFCKDKKYLKYAVPWAKRAVESHSPPYPSVLYTYSRLLFEIGQKQSGIEIMKQAINLSGGNNSNYEKALKEMESFK